MWVEFYRVIKNWSIWLRAEVNIILFVSSSKQQGSGLEEGEGSENTFNDGKIVIEHGLYQVNYVAMVHYNDFIENSDDKDDDEEEDADNRAPIKAMCL